MLLLSPPRKYYFTSVNKCLLFTRCYTTENVARCSLAHFRSLLSLSLVGLLGLIHVKLLRSSWQHQSATGQVVSVFPLGRWAQWVLEMSVLQCRDITGPHVQCWFRNIPRPFLFLYLWTIGLSWHYHSKPKNPPSRVVSQCSLAFQTKSTKMKKIQTLWKYENIKYKIRKAINISFMSIFKRLLMYACSSYYYHCCY